VEAREILDNLLPGDVRVLSELERGDLLLEVEGVALPFSALSDGYRAFLAWAGDLLYRLTIACPSSLPLNRLAGVVLVDEVDLHLHPAWQREVLHRLGAAFPRLQIIGTTHSPLVLGSVRHEQVRVLRSERGISKILQPPEGTWGRSADQLLASRFFGLKHTRDQAFVTELERAERAASEGGLDEAIRYARLLSRGGETK
jgi:predicted ATP-binding protein involved in virulence